MRWILCGTIQKRMNGGVAPQGWEGSGHVWGQALDPLVLPCRMWMLQALGIPASNGRSPSHSSEHPWAQKPSTSGSQPGHLPSNSCLELERQQIHGSVIKENVIIN